MKHQIKISVFNHDSIPRQRKRGENVTLKNQKHKKKENWTLSKVLDQIFAIIQNSVELLEFSYTEIIIHLIHITVITC